MLAFRLLDIKYLYSFSHSHIGPAFFDSYTAPTPIVVVHRLTCLAATGGHRRRQRLDRYMSTMHSSKRLDASRHSSIDDAAVDLLLRRHMPPPGCLCTTTTIATLHFTQACNYFSAAAFLRSLRFFLGCAIARYSSRGLIDAIFRLVLQK